MNQVNLDKLVLYSLSLVTNGSTDIIKIMGNSNHIFVL